MIQGKRRQENRGYATGKGSISETNNEGYLKLIKKLLKLITERILPLTQQSIRNKIISCITFAMVTAAILDFGLFLETFENKKIDQKKKKIRK